MTIFLAPYYAPSLDEFTPTWSEFAAKTIHDYLVNKGMQIADPKQDNDILFIGETSPDIHLAATQSRRFSILLFHPNILTSLSDTVIQRVQTLYAVNSEHRFLIRQTLDDRFPHKVFDVKLWSYLPKPFEPPSRSRPLIGIFEPDFNSDNVFDIFYAALDSIYVTALYQLDFDIAFYTLTQNTYDSMSRSISMNSKVSLINVIDPNKSPLVDISLMPDALLSLDTYRYNPILSSFGQIIPVMKPTWTNPQEIPKIISELRSPVSGYSAKNAYSLITNFVNQVRRVEELEASPSIQVQMLRSSILGEIYGDYSKFRKFPTSG